MGFSSCGSLALELWLSSCGTRAELLHGMWDIPGPGLEPMSPALAGGFSTTVPPGKPGTRSFLGGSLPGLCFALADSLVLTSWLICLRALPNVHVYP